MILNVVNYSLRKLALLLCALACLYAGAQAQERAAPVVRKVEPPSWWAAHTINPVRLLVRGENLHGARVTATRAGTEASGAVVNPAGTYLFLNVTIAPAARPGDYPLTLETSGGSTTIPFRLEEPLDPARNFQGITTDDVIYLIMIDRFANGDTANDLPAGAPPGTTDRNNPRAYHGGDLRGIINRLPYLKELGVTALWLTPWHDNWNGMNTCDRPWCPNTYYHGYHTVDYYGVEDRFGDMRTLRELVERAHALGIKVIQDQVANHIGSRHPWATDPPLSNWFNGTLRQHAQNEFRHDYLLSPYAPEEARRRTLNGWFADDMPDMNQDEPEVARYEIQNALWWVGMTGIDGIRQDTIQYMPRPFMRDLTGALRRQYPRLWMVGEVFDRDPAHTSFFMGGRAGWDGIDTGLHALFDFPLWQASLDVFTDKRPVRALRDVLKYDGLYVAPARLVVMANNHDTRRFLSLEGSNLEGAMLHVAFILTMRGTPQLYYGEEIAMEGGEDPDNRRDFPGGFPGDERDAFTARGRTPREQRMFAWTRDWMRLRREQAALRQETTTDLSFDDHAYVYARRSGAEIVVIAINRAAEPRSLPVSATALDLADGTQLVPLLAARDRAVAANGLFSLSLPARSIVAYKVARAGAR